MSKEFIKPCYEVPTITLWEVAVERGFAASDNTGDFGGDADEESGTGRL